MRTRLQRVNILRAPFRCCAVVVLAAALQGCCANRPIDATVPLLADESEAFEKRIGMALPGGWTIDRHHRAPMFAVGKPTSEPYRLDSERYWILSTPWPGKEPQRAQVVLYLFRDPAGVPAHLERLATWERFALFAQDPADVSIGGSSFTWSTLPGWSGARAAIVAAMNP